MERCIHGEDADHPSIATSLRQLTMILQKKGDFGGAESQYRAGLVINRRILGEVDPDVAPTERITWHRRQESVVQHGYGGHSRLRVLTSPFSENRNSESG